MEIIFWSSLTIVAWCYVGYPLVMELRAKFVATPIQDVPAEDRTVTVVVAARNEERRIAGRLENLLQQEYSTDKLEVVVVCNGCTDRTKEIVEEYHHRDRRVRLFSSPARDGKAGALNVGVAAAHGSIVIFADARQHFQGDVIRRLVACFGDPAVGGVSGRLVITNSDSPSLRGVNRYWDFETRLRVAESRTGSVVGATGAIYAIRRELFEPLPSQLILDDVYLPLRIVARGHRMVLEPRAVAVDEPASSQRAEFRRKLRTMVGNVQLIRMWPELLIPWKSPAFYRFASHKAFRLAVPLCLLVLLVAGSLLDGSFYKGIVLGQLFFYALGALGLVVPIPVLSIPAAFLLVNAAVLCAILRVKMGTEAVWRPDSTEPRKLG